ARRPLDEAARRAGRRRRLGVGGGRTAGGAAEGRGRRHLRLPRAPRRRGRRPVALGRCGQRGRPGRRRPVGRGRAGGLVHGCGVERRRAVGWGDGGGEVGGVGGEEGGWELDGGGDAVAGGVVEPDLDAV